MTTKSRIAKVERNAEKRRMTWREFITLPPEFWERSMDALAEVFGVTRAELEDWMKKLSSGEQAEEDA
jgi:hypothetical protein